MSCKSTVRYLSVTLPEKDLVKFIKLTVTSKHVEQDDIRDKMIDQVNAKLESMDFGPIINAEERTDIVVSGVLGESLFPYLNRSDAAFYLKALRESSEQYAEYYIELIGEYFGQLICNLKGLRLAKFLSHFYVDAEHFAKEMIGVDSLKGGWDDEESDDFDCAGILYSITESVPVNIELEFENSCEPSYVFTHEYKYRKTKDEFSFKEFDEPHPLRDEDDF